MKLSNINMPPCLAISIMLAFYSSPAIAQDNVATNNVENKSEEGYIEEITVNGQRITDREASVSILSGLSILETPFSVRAISNDFIENVFARAISETVKTDASVNFAATAGSYGDTVQIRGLPANALVDGAFTDSGQQAFPTDIIERVEVLKGATTFLTGSTPSSGAGGLLNLVLKRPTADPITNISLQYANKSHFRGIVDLSRKTSLGEGDIGFRFVTVHEDGNQVVDRYNDKRSAVYLAVDWDPMPELKIKADVLYSRADQDGYQDVTLVNPGFDIPKAPSGSVNLKPWAIYQPKAVNAKISAAWQFMPNWTLTAFVAGTDNETFYATPGFPTIINEAGDFSSDGIFNGTFANEILTLDTRLSGRFETGFITHKVGVGYSYLTRKRGQTFGQYYPPFNDLIPLIQSNIYDPQFPSFDVPTFVDQSRITRTDLKSVTTSFYANDILSVMDDKLSVLAGVRRVEFDERSRPTCGLSPLDGVNACPPLEPYLVEKTAKWTPSFAVFGEPTNGVLLYANYAEHLQPGGTAGVQFSNAGQTLSPIASNQYEVGTKISVSRAIVTLAAFTIDRELQFVDPDTNVFGNFGTQRNKGIELVVEGTLTKGLVATGAVTYIDATLKETGDTTIDGNTMTGIPKWSASLFVDYALSAVPGLAVNATVTHNSSQFYDLSNLQSIPSWTRFDLGGRYRFDAGRTKLTLSAYLQNVFGMDYWQTANGDGFQSLGRGAGRTINVGLTAGF